ncbi:hypothetical protein ACGFY7_39325 [Streptomyces prunicolor]|uniref:hypothetical protein n=1 Tax=Streptomyces prunicolor TaxID=67348 RepID=UPI00371101DC
MSPPAAPRHVPALVGEGRRKLCAHRPAILEERDSFFYDGDRPLRAEELDGPFRRGSLTISRAASRAEPT